MTRAELHERVTPIIDGLEDHAHGITPLTRERARELAEDLDEIADQLMREGVVG